MEFIKQLLNEARVNLADVPIGNTEYGYGINDFSYEIDFENSELPSSNAHHTGEEVFPCTAIFYVYVYRVANPESDLQIPDLELHVPSKATHEWGDDSFDYTYGSIHGRSGGPYGHADFTLGKQAAVAKTAENQHVVKMLQKSGLLQGIIDSFNARLADPKIHKQVEDMLTKEVERAVDEYVEMKKKRYDDDDGYDDD